MDGIPALRLALPASPGVVDYQDIYFIKGDKLFKMSLLDTAVESNMEIYDQILSTFRFKD